MTAQVVEAVQYCHNLNIMHRDIKAENIMFSRPVAECLVGGEPLSLRLLDFGLAGRVSEGGRGCYGSRGFIAPEVILNEAHTVSGTAVGMGSWL